MRLEHAPAIAIGIGRAAQGWHVIVADTPVDVSVETLDSLHVRVIHGSGEAHTFSLSVEDTGRAEVMHCGQRWCAVVESQLAAMARVVTAGTSAVREVVAPMPGLIASIHVQPGQAVAAGELLLVMEAMKLMTSLIAPAAAVVARIDCRPGEIVKAFQPLVHFQSGPESKEVPQ